MKKQDKKRIVKNWKRMEKMVHKTNMESVSLNRLRMVCRGEVIK